jgi:hypothetical protein
MKKLINSNLLGLVVISLVVTAAMPLKAQSTAIANPYAQSQAKSPMPSGGKPGGPSSKGMFVGLVYNGLSQQTSKGTMTFTDKSSRSVSSVEKFDDQASSQVPASGIKIGYIYMPAFNWGANLALTYLDPQNKDEFYDVRMYTFEMNATYSINKNFAFFMGLNGLSFSEPEKVADYVYLRAGAQTGFSFRFASRVHWSLGYSSYRYASEKDYEFAEQKLKVISDSSLSGLQSSVSVSF